MQSMPENPPPIILWNGFLNKKGGVASSLGAWLATPPKRPSIYNRLFAVDDPFLPGKGGGLGAVDQV